MRRQTVTSVLLLASSLAFSAAPVMAEPIAKKLFGAKKDAADMTPRAYGSYARGCLAGGVSLPVSGHGWEAMKLQRNRNWGHPVLVKLLERFANETREKDGWPGLLIGDLAQPRGGPMLTGHRSHQIGLDADIWYRPKPDRKLSDKERADSWSIPLAEEFGQDVIRKNWNPGYVKIIKRAASYPETARIFVHPAVKKALCEGAGSDRAWLRKVRPWWKHNYHFHLRLRCPPGFEGCVDQKPPPEGDGCDQLDGWFKKLKAAEEWSRKKPKDPVKPKPRKELRLADLPDSCRAVLEAKPASATRRQGAVTQRPPVRQSAVKTDPNLPWLRGVSAPDPAGPAQVPLPDRKPR